MDLDESTALQSNPERFAAQLHGSRRVQRLVRLLALLLVVVALPPIVNVYAFNAALGVIKVAATGMCPSHPPDIAARPCTTGEYLAADWGAWDVAGAVIWSAMWGVFALSGWLPYAVGSLARDRLRLHWTVVVTALCAIPFGLVVSSIVLLWGPLYASFYLFPLLLVGAAVVLAVWAWSRDEKRRALGVGALGLTISFALQGLFTWLLGGAR